MKKRVERSLPAYFRSLSLKNYRGYRAVTDIPFRPLTFLVGQNSSGKSSLFSAFLLLAQSDFGRLSPEQQTPRWGGPLIDLGSFKDTAYRHQPERRIGISIDLDPGLIPPPWRRAPRRGKTDLVRTEFELRAGQGDMIGRLSRVRIVDLPTGEAVVLNFGRSPSATFGGKKAAAAKPGRAGFTEAASAVLTSSPASRRLRHVLQEIPLWLLTIGCQRVSSGRSGPKRWYSAADSREGYRERYSGSAALFDSVDPEMVAEQVHQRLRSSRQEEMDERHSRDTLAKLLKDLDIASGIKRSQVSAYHSSIEVTDSVTGVESFLIDVGYGASQVIPIVRACLTGSPSPIFVEQPEIHLHPRAQGVLADFLCRTAARRQVVVETHSVRMINRCRILIAKGELDPKNVVINFVERARSGAKVRSIGIRENGDFDQPWPGGFFDERFEDTMQLLSLKKGD